MINDRLSTVQADLPIHSWRLETAMITSSLISMGQFTRVAGHQ